MNHLDIILAIPLLWFAYKGFRKGLVIELTSLVALLLGIYMAIHFSDITATYLSEWFNIQGKYISIVSFSLTFIGVVILVYFVGKLIEKFVDILLLGLVNKALGMLFGLLKMALVLSTFIYILNSISINILPKQSCDQSMLFRPIERLVPALLPKLNKFRDKWREESLPAEKHDEKIG